jgi:cell division protein FtsA
VLDMGGYHLSHDVAMGMNTAFETAEWLKVRYGHALPERVGEDETVWAATFGERAERNFSRRFLCMVLEARATEMFELIRDELEKLEALTRLPAGLVITGGASQMNGMVELGRRILEKPVRVGAPLPALPITGLSRGLLSPAYATTVGLLLWGLREGAQSPRRPAVPDGSSASPGQPGTPPAWWLRAKGLLRHLLPG